MKIERDELLLYAVTDRSWLKDDETLEPVTEELLKGGVTMVQLREKHASSDERAETARRLLPVCHEYSAKLIINDDIEACIRSGADGVHLGQGDTPVREARALLGADKVIGTSAHNVAEALEGQAAGADYLGSGAVFGSSTKTDAGTLPLDEFARICAAVEIPVCAIGGISKDNISKLSGTGLSAA